LEKIVENYSITLDTFDGDEDFGDSLIMARLALDMGDHRHFMVEVNGSKVWQLATVDEFLAVLTSANCTCNERHEYRATVEGNLAKSGHFFVTRMRHDMPMGTVYILRPLSPVERKDNDL
jgi:hypothetical protein